MKQLPVLPAFLHTVKSTLNNLPFAFHVSWPWLLLSFPFHVAAAIYITSSFPAYDPEKADQATTLKVMSVQLPIGILALLSSASIAVSWHRFILKDEVPQGWQRLRLDATVLRYFGNFFLLALLIAAIAFIPSFVIATFANLTSPAALVFMVPLFAAMFVLGLRYSVKFPAIAMNQPNFGFRDAFNATAGNNLQILGLLVLTTLPGVLFGLAMIVMAKLLGLFSGVFPSIFLLAVQFMVNWIITIFSVTVLTSLYGFFVEKRSF